MLEITKEDSFNILEIAAGAGHLLRPTFAHAGLAEGDVVIAHQLDGRVDGFGARTLEHHFVEPGRRVSDQFSGQISSQFSTPPTNGSAQAPTMAAVIHPR